jgi:hypothetical protein
VLVFFDESGDPGMAGKPSQSKLFVVVSVIFEDHDEAHACDERISLLRRELRLPSDFEFHFSKNHPNIRRAFLQAVMPYEWFFVGVVVRKEKLYGQGFKFKGPFYKYLTGLVFSNAKPYLSDAIVVCDETGSGKFKSELATYLRKKVDLSGRLIKKVKTEDSKTNNLTQMADMVCGALHRWAKGGKADSREYRNIIRHRELRVQRWPK